MAHRVPSLLRRIGIHILPPPRQLQRHGLQSLRPYVVIRRVIVRFVVISLVCIRFPRPLLHSEDVFTRIHLRLIIQPSRHIPNSHVVPVRIAITRFADNGIHARRECYLGRPSSAKELGVEVDAFAVDLLDVLFGIRRVAGVEVPADAEQVARVELDFLAFEDAVDGFADISLQAGHVTVLHPGHTGFPEGQVKTERSTCAFIQTYDLGNVVVTSMRLFADDTLSGPPIA